MGSQGCILDLDFLLSYSDLTKQLEHKVGTHLSCWDVKEVKNIENIEQI